MRKQILILAGLCLLCFAACKTAAPQGTVTGEPGKEESKGVSTTFSAKDYNQDEESVRVTEHGYYYYSYSHGGFRYVDGATGTEMYLCNKPECKHDGNAFCVATNDKYTVLGTQLYSGRIVANVVEETDTQYLYKLLDIAPDGSIANEIVTYYTLEKTGAAKVVLHGAGGILIHRNKAMLPMLAGGVESLEDTKYCGCAIVDLNTKEVTYLDEVPFAKENAEVTDISAFGDYIYYCRKEGKKTVLHRYHIGNGTDETHKLLVGFGGEYCIPDEEHVVYLKSTGRDLCVYSYATGENEEKLKLMGTKTFFLQDGTTMESEEAYTAVGVQTDGDYFYVAEQSYTTMSKNSVSGETEEKNYARVYVYDREFESVTVLNLAEERNRLLQEGETKIYGAHTELTYLGDKIYWVLSNGVDTQYMMTCEKNGFLAGTPEFQLIYTIGK